MFAKDSLSHTNSFAISSHPVTCVVGQWTTWLYSLREDTDH